MPRSKHAPVVSATSTDLTHEEIAALTAAVEQLRQQVEVLTDVLDQVRDDLNWAINNCEEFRSSPSYIMHITSMPADPLAEDFGERVNRFSARDLPPELQASPRPPAEPVQQGDLFH